MLGSSRHLSKMYNAAGNWAAGLGLVGWQD